MNLSELDVVNQCLGTMGETPLNSLDADHPFVAAAQLKLKVANTQEQAVGWWFNTDHLTLQPDPNTHFIYASGDGINVNPDDNGSAYILRGRRLYDRFAGTYEFQAPVTIWLVRELPFEDLPALASHLIGLRTVLDFQNEYDSDPQKYQKLAATYTQVRAALRAEHIRQVKSNLLYTDATLPVMRLVTPLGRLSRGW